MSGLKHIPTANERIDARGISAPGYVTCMAMQHDEIADLRADRERLHAELVAMTAERDALRSDVVRYIEALTGIARSNRFDRADFPTDEEWCQWAQNLARYMVTYQIDKARGVK